MRERRHEVDWLRVLAVLLLIYFHTAVIFVHGTNFHIRNEQKSTFLDIFVGFVDQWFMPLFFLLSGAASSLALRFRSGGQYVTERIKRLLIPLVFGTLVIIPPQIYFQRLSENVPYASYVRFYPHFFDGVYPKGNFTWNQLWFIAYLFVFSLLCVPLFLYLREKQGTRFIEHLASFCKRPGAIFLFAVPLVISEVFLRGRFPGPQNFVDDWASFVYYIQFFVYGYLLYVNPGMGEIVDRSRRVALTLGMVSTLIGVVWIFGLGTEPGPNDRPGWIVLMTLRGFNSWFWVLAILGFGRRYLNIRNGLLAYANQAAYPFYILHQTVIIFFAFYIVQWKLGIAGKYLLISSVSLPATVILYDVFVKRTRLTRFLFGMKERKVETQTMPNPRASYDQRRVGTGG